MPSSTALDLTGEALGLDSHGLKIKENLYALGSISSKKKDLNGNILEKLYTTSQKTQQMESTDSHSFWEEDIK
jgi:hypothetical protein